MLGFIFKINFLIGDQIIAAWLKAALTYVINLCRAAPLKPLELY